MNDLYKELGEIFKPEDLSEYEIIIADIKI